MKAGKRPCEFCRTNKHKLCPGKIEKASNSNPDHVWYCPCSLKGHVRG